MPFEDSVDITIYVRDHGRHRDSGSRSHLIALPRVTRCRCTGPSLPVLSADGFAQQYDPDRCRLWHGPVSLAGAQGSGAQTRLDGQGTDARGASDTGLEHLYLNVPGVNQDQYFDSATQRAFEALKTRYSATALDRSESTAANMDALWRLMGQGRRVRVPCWLSRRRRGHGRGHVAAPASSGALARGQGRAGQWWSLGGISL